MVMLQRTTAFLAFFIATLSFAQRYKPMNIGHSNSIQKAEFHAILAPHNPSAVIVFVPGFEVDGREIATPEWIDFCQRNNWALGAMNFSSRLEDVAAGHGFVESGAESGNMLLQAIKRLNWNETPLLLLGYSSGGQFVWSFANTFPKRVTAWCAFSASRFTPEVNDGLPAGIMSCGDRDTFRFDETLLAFQRARLKSRPLAWVTLAGTGHERPFVLEPFVREFFLCRIEHKAELGGIWIHNFEKSPLECEPTAPDLLQTTSWLPDQKTLRQWQSIHTP